MRKKTALFFALLLLSGSVLRAAPWPDHVPRGDRAYLRQVMRETWCYIDFFVSPITGLPYDSNQAKDITNTTNIGLYLASLSMAYKLGYVTEEYAVARITKILDSLDTYENWRRLYNNWLDPDGQQRSAKPGDNNISDYNKLPAGLIVVRQTFPQLAERCTAFLDEIPWELFLEAETGKIRYAFDIVKKQTLSPVRFFRGEDKILAHFLMIASGKVPPATWENHDLSEEERYGYKYYKFGWQGGGLFMQFICDLFLDNRGTPLGKSAANFAWVQMVHASEIGSPVWGWSACVGPGGSYLGMNLLVDEVVTPHASALAVNLFPREVVDNLRRLETFGLREPCIVDGEPRRFGFRDSVNWKSGQIADKYLLLDQAMLFLALVNYCHRGLLWKAFDSDPLVQNGKQLIRDYRLAGENRAAEHRYIRSLSWDQPGTYWLGDREGTTYRPGDTVRKALWVRSLSSKPCEGYEEHWRVTDAGGNPVAEGRLPVELPPHATRKLAEVLVPTETAEYGSSWVFESSLLKDGCDVRASAFKIRFPSYVPLVGDWRLESGDQPERADPAFDDSSWKTANVPARWEDDGLPEYDGTAWYRLHFTLPPAALERWGDQRLAVVLGAVDDADETFLNGQKIGQGGSFPPASETAWNKIRVYEFDRGVLTDTNVLAVRVSDWGGNGGIWRGPLLIGPVKELSAAAAQMP